MLRLVRKGVRVDCWLNPQLVRSRLVLVTEGRQHYHASQDCTDFEDSTLGHKSPRKAWIPSVVSSKTGMTPSIRNSKQVGGGTMHVQNARTMTEEVALLKNCLQQGLPADSYMYINVLKLCLRKKDPVAAKQIHDLIIKSGLERHLFVMNTLLNVYIRCGKLQDARRVFDDLEEKSVVTWNIMIGGYAKNGDAQEAWELFNRMRQRGMQRDELTYLSILKAFGSPSALKWGKEVHGCLRQDGLESDVRVGTALLQMYAKCGCVTEARRVFDNLTSRNTITCNVMIGEYVTNGSIDDARLIFDRMENRDVITWNTVIGAYAERGSLEEAFRLSLKMKEEGLKPDAITYLSILNTPTGVGGWEWVKKVHSHALEDGLESDLRVGNALMHMYAKSGEIRDAQLVFDRMKKRDVITWNTIIGGYAESNCHVEAGGLFLTMKKEGFRPTPITFVNLLNASASASGLDWIRQVHQYILEAGLESDLRVANALVRGYAKSGSIEDARLIFNKIVKRDIVAWNTMSGAYAESGRGLEAYQLFLQMIEEGFKPDAITLVSLLNPSASDEALDWVKDVHNYVVKTGLDSDLRVSNALVHMYATSGSIEDAQQTFDKMEIRDVFTWTMLIGAYAKLGFGLEAYQLFLQMKKEGFTPDGYTYASILNASASATEGSLNWVKEIHGHVLEAGLESDLRVGNALVHMYAKSGSVEEARLAFNRMEKRDKVTWNTMIGGLAQHGFGHESLKLLKQMEVEGIKPDGTTFVAVLSACCHTGLLDEGRKLFAAMTKDYGIEPTVVHCTCMVDLLGRAGQMEEAKLFIKSMPVKPVSVTWGALLGACRTYKNVEIGEVAAQELLKLEPQNAGAFVLLSNIYAAAGKWEKVSKVRAMMQERGIQKEPGRSWIEVDNKIHSFVAGDTYHPEAKEIYSELNKLIDRVKAEGYIPDTQLVLQNMDEQDKGLALCSHSERLAITYGLMRTPPGQAIRIYKNLRVCPDCHTATKFISKVTGREIIARDANRFHHFRDGVCSCGDYW